MFCRLVLWSVSPSQSRWTICSAPTDMWLRRTLQCEMKLDEKKSDMVGVAGPVTVSAQSDLLQKSMTLDLWQYTGCSWGLHWRGPAEVQVHLEINCSFVLYLQIFLRKITNNVHSISKSISDISVYLCQCSLSVDIPISPSFQNKSRLENRMIIILRYSDAVIRMHKTSQNKISFRPQLGNICREIIDKTST